MRLLPFILLGSTSVLCAQSFTPKTIAFDGVPQYRAADLLAVSGVAPGKPLTQADIEAAMHRLDDTGLFAGIQFTTGDGVLRFVLEPTAAGHMRTVAYTNFVWYTKPELDAAVHAKLPLFNGTVPVEGDMAGRVERALEAVVKERGAEVTVRSIGGQGGALTYRVADPSVVVGKLTINGVDFSSDAALEAVRTRMVGSEYVEGTLEGTTGDLLRRSLGDAFLELGYLDEEVGPIGHGQPRVEGGSILVDLTAAARPGGQYRVSRLDLPLLAAVSPAELEKAVQLEVGKPAARILLLSSFARMNAAFERHGYLDAATSAEPAKDTAAHTIAYTFHTAQGGQYKMRTLVFAGMSAQQQSELTQAWKLKTGTAYDGAAEARYMEAEPALTICGGGPVQASLVRDRATHEVDVSLSCSLRARSR